ncbi:phenylalanine--tRNA ligase subunit beta, partial [Patescibacteria group bacterium]|nr:phenylalanine--tRNA ligase subunit beta [Patescibacteria group bacterium]
MNFSYNWLQSFFKRKLPSPEKLADLLSRRFAEVEEIRKENKDIVLDIDIRPNRAGDCFSHLGIAREISAILNFKLQIAVRKLIEDKNLKAKDFVSVDVKHRQSCPRYTARVICDVKVGPSPKWIQERLKVCGLRPINNIVDIANYAMLETGQPLHAFDFEKIEADKRGYQRGLTRKIIVRFAKKGEKIFTLDNKEYDLDKEILVIADSKEPLAIAGIKGGKKAEIDEKTKIVVLESANFNPKVIRGGSRKIDLKTDASRRFEHGIDPNLTEIAINRAAGLIQEIAHQQGGCPKVCHGLVDFYPQKVLPKKIKLDLDYVEGLLGVKISQKEIIKILKSLGLKIEPRPKPKNQFSQSGARQINLGRGKILNVVVPTFRLDISIPEYLIEEIGRIYGYQKIKPIFPLAVLIPPKRNFELFWEDMVKDILKEAGF